MVRASRLVVSGNPVLRRATQASVVVPEGAKEDAIAGRPPALRLQGGIVLSFVDDVTVAGNEVAEVGEVPFGPQGRPVRGAGIRLSACAGGRVDGNTVAGPTAEGAGIRLRAVDLDVSGNRLDGNVVSLRAVASAESTPAAVAALGADDVSFQDSQVLGALARAAQVPRRGHVVAVRGVTTRAHGNRVTNDQTVHETSLLVHGTLAANATGNQTASCILVTGAQQKRRDNQVFTAECQQSDPYEETRQ